MDEVVDERRHVDIAGVAPLRVGEVVRLYDLLHRVHVALDVCHLLGRELLFLRVDARPSNLARHDAVADAGHLRGKCGVVLVVGVDAQQVAAGQVAPRRVALLQLGNVHAVSPALYGLREDVDAAIVAVHGQFHHLRAWSPVAHVAPQLEGQRVAHGRHVVVGRQQHPVAVGGHAQQRGVQFLALFVAQFDGVFLLVERERAVAAQLDAYGAVVACGLHVRRHLLPGVERRVGCYDNLFKTVSAVFLSLYCRCGKGNKQ